MNDLRGYMELLKKSYPDDVIEIQEEIDPDYLVMAISKELEKRGNPVIVFSRLKKYDLPIITNVLGSRERIALAIGSTPENILQAWSSKIQTKVKPRLVSSGPVKDVVMTGDKVDCTKLPIHRFFQEDGGKYITNALMVVKDPETKKRNLSYSRTQLVGANTLRNSMHSRGHQWMIYRKAESMGQNLEVAIVIGAHPSLLLAGATRFVPLGLDEYEIAGALLEEPIDLVKCETIDIEVPAYAEIVIEGEILADIRENEGPFGEYTGYASGRSTQNVIKVKAITHRKDAFYQDILAGNSLEHLFLMGIPKQAIVFEKIKQTLPAVKQINWPTCGVNFICFLQLAAPIDDGLPNLAGTLLLGLDSYVKIVVILDEDIDIYDEKQVFWAISTRVDPSLHLNLLKDIFCNRLDPSATDAGTVGKMIIDATKKKGGQYTKLTIPVELEAEAERIVKNLF